MQARPERAAAAGSSAEALRVFRVDAGRQEWVLMLSDAYGGVMTHWARSNSVYCDPRGCNPIYHKTQAVWKGYAAAVVYDEPRKLWRPICLEISERAELDLRGRFARGQVWRFERLPQSGKKKQPVTAELVETKEAGQCRPAFDLLPTLMHLYHCCDILLNVKNPLPLRTMVEPHVGEPPPGVGERAHREQPATREEVTEMLKKAREGFAMPANGNGHKRG